MDTKDMDISQEPTIAGTEANDGGKFPQNNPGECSVCFIMFDGTERRPRTLPCGHTFCTKCITYMIEERNISCPSCRVDHEAASADQFPICYIAEVLLKNLKTLTLLKPPRNNNAAEEPSPSAEGASSSMVPDTCGDALMTITRSLKKLLGEQKSRMMKDEIDQQKMQSQLKQYRTQLANWTTQHHQLLDSLNDLVQQNKSALDLLKQEDSSVLVQMTKGQDVDKQRKTALRSMESIIKAEEVQQVITQADHCMDEAQDWENKCQELFPNINTVTTSMKVCSMTRRAISMVDDEVGAPKNTTRLRNHALPLLDKLNILLKCHQLHVDELKQMRPAVRRLVEAVEVFGVQKYKDGFRYSKVTIENGQLHLHCFQKQPLPHGAFTLPLSEMAEALNPSSVLTFLDMAWGGSLKGRVYIRLRPDTSWGRQFVLLCSGQLGHSYVNTCLLDTFNKGEINEYVVGGDYEYNNGKGGPSLLDHPNENFRESGKAGSVLISENRKVGGQFIITTRDRTDQRSWAEVIGDVESGLEVVREAVSLRDIKQATVVDCGVIVPL